MRVASTGSYGSVTVTTIPEALVRWFTERLVMLMTVTFLVLAVAQSAQPSTVLFAGVVAMAAGMLLLAHYSAVIVSRQSITVGGRSREHREPLSEMPAPRHPDTAGRPRTRAPSQSPSAA